MARGRLVPPNLDDRKWQDIVDQAKALIPTYAPEWTDRNPSDLGIALIELFAWLVEGLIYRLNRVPEKNFIEFLNLIGITRDPPTPASTYLTYRSVEPLTVHQGSQAATQQTETEEAIVFETDEDLTVLPINLTTALLIEEGEEVAEANQQKSRYKNVTANLVGSPLSGLSLNIPQSQSITITLGFDRQATAKEITLLCHFFQPVKSNELEITWLYSQEQGSNDPTSWNSLQTVDDKTEIFQKNGAVSFTVPEDWVSQNPQTWRMTADSMTEEFKQPRFWIGVRLRNSLDQSLELGIGHFLFNSVLATNALSISQPELLGTSNGKPFQFFELENAPLFRRPNAEDPYDHLSIQVREPRIGGGFGDWTEWTHRDDFPAGPGLYFRLNAVTGTINFGNYDPVTSPDGHGSIPPLDSEIRARGEIRVGDETKTVPAYRYVAGGARGNVAPETITVIRTPLSGIVSVTNLGAASGGSDEEAIEDTKRRGPEVLRNRYRAVTVEDYEYLAKEATTDVKKVRCLPPRLFTAEDEALPKPQVGPPWTYGGLNRSINIINVIIVPDAPLSEPKPIPSEKLRQEVSDYLEERRVLTNLLHVTYPRYLPIIVTAEIKIWSKALATGLVSSTNDYQIQVETKIKEFLHPVLGGTEKRGWEVGQDIVISSLLDLIQPEPAIGFVATLTVQAGPPEYDPPERPSFLGNSSVWVQLADYELICSGTHDVSVSEIKQDNAA